MIIIMIIILTTILTKCCDDLLPGEACGAEQQHVEGGQDGDRGEQGVTRALLPHRPVYHRHGQVPDGGGGTDNHHQDIKKV